MHVLLNFFIIFLFVGINGNDDNVPSESDMWPAK